MNLQVMFLGSIAGTLAVIGLAIAAFIALIIGWVIHPYTVGEFTRWVDSPIKQFTARIGTSATAALATVAVGIWMMEDKSQKPNLEQNYQPSSIESSAIESSAIGKWQINIERSPLDDSKTVKGSLDADSLVKMGGHTERPVLTILYKEGELQAHISFQSFLGTDATDVTTRFGKDAPTTESWVISTDNKTLFVPGESAAFVDKLNSSETLVLRVTPSSGSSVTLSFNATGLEAVMDAIKQASSSAAAAETTNSSDSSDDQFAEPRPAAQSSVKPTATPIPDPFAEPRPAASVVDKPSAPSVARVEQPASVRPTAQSVASTESPKTIPREITTTRSAPEVVETPREKPSSMPDSEGIKPNADSLQLKVAELKGELAVIDTKIETERGRWQEGAGVINRLTNFKKTPVREGSPQYHQCMAASRVIKEVEAGAAALKAEKARLEAMIQALENK